MSINQSINQLISQSINKSTNEHYHLLIYFLNVDWLIFLQITGENDTSAANNWCK